MFKVNPNNNFCRVFELPKKLSEEFCFDGGIAHIFLMVDWFNPILFNELNKVGDTDIDIKFLEKEIIPFIKQKNYRKLDRNYLVLFDFGAAILIKKEC